MGNASGGGNRRKGGMQVSEEMRSKLSKHILNDVFISPEDPRAIPTMTQVFAILSNFQISFYNGGLQPHDRKNLLILLRSIPNITNEEAFMIYAYFNQLLVGGRSRNLSPETVEFNAAIDKIIQDIKTSGRNESFIPYIDMMYTAPREPPQPGKGRQLVPEDIGAIRLILDKYDIDKTRIILSKIDAILIDADY